MIYDYYYFYFCQHRLTNEQFNQIARLPKFEILYTLDVVNFNNKHEKFNVKYIDGEELAQIPEIVLHRMNLANGFDEPSITWSFDFESCPSEAKYKKQGWIRFLIGELEQYRNILSTFIPQLTPGNIKAILQFIAGRYRGVRGSNTITALRKLEVDEDLESLADHEAYLGAVRELPQSTPVYARLLGAPPTGGWVDNEDVFGPCPDGSELLLYMRLPSSNRSKKDL
jgi:hypothetical protein